MAKQHVELLHIARHQKDSDAKIQWKIHGSGLPKRRPELIRMSSNPCDDRERKTIPAVGGLPKMKRSYSEGEPETGTTLGQLSDSK